MLSERMNRCVHRIVWFCQIASLVLKYEYPRIAWRWSQCLVYNWYVCSYCLFMITTRIKNHVQSINQLCIGCVFHLNKWYTHVAYRQASHGGCVAFIFGHTRDLLHGLQTMPCGHHKGIMRASQLPILLFPIFHYLIFNLNITQLEMAWRNHCHPTWNDLGKSWSLTPGVQMTSADIYCNILNIW